MWLHIEGRICGWGDGLDHCNFYSFQRSLLVCSSVWKAYFQVLQCSLSPLDNSQKFSLACWSPHSLNFTCKAELLPKKLKPAEVQVSWQYLVILNKEKYLTITCIKKGASNNCAAILPIPTLHIPSFPILLSRALINFFLQGWLVFNKINELIQLTAKPPKHRSRY